MTRGHRFCNGGLTIMTKPKKTTLREQIYAYVVDRRYASSRQIRAEFAKSQNTAPRQRSSYIAGEIKNLVNAGALRMEDGVYKPGSGQIPTQCLDRRQRIKKQAESPLPDYMPELLGDIAQPMRRDVFAAPSYTSTELTSCPRPGGLQHKEIKSVGYRC